MSESSSELTQVRYSAPYAEPSRIVFLVVDAEPSTEVVTIPSVDVATMGSLASGVVFLTGVLALLVGWLTGFYFIYPPFAALISLLSCVFYAMSTVLRRRWRHK